MGAGRPLFDLARRGWPAAALSAARGLQCAALDRAGRRALALAADQLPGPGRPAYQQTRRWLEAGCFEALVHDLRLLRLEQGRARQPSAAILDARVLQSSPESGARAGYDGHKRRRGSKVHAAVDTLGHLLALTVTTANADERTQVEALAEQVQQVSGAHVELAWVDQGYTGEAVARTAAAHGIQLEVVQPPEAKRGCVLVPRRWVVERSFACLLLHRVVPLIVRP